MEPYHHSENSRDAYFWGTEIWESFYGINTYVTSSVIMESSGAQIGRSDNFAIYSSTVAVSNSYQIRILQIGCNTRAT
jgi:hypothetical protein